MEPFCRVETERIRVSSTALAKKSLLLRPPFLKIPRKSSFSIIPKSWKVRHVNTFIPFEKTHIEQAISERFEQLTCRYPDKVAVKTTQESLTYKRLNSLLNQIARAILTICGTGNLPVALFFEQSALLIAAILGILKAGKIYVPLDPLHQKPAEFTHLAHTKARPSSCGLPYNPQESTLTPHWAGVI